MRKISLFVLSSVMAVTTFVGCNGAAEPVVEEPVIEEIVEEITPEPTAEPTEEPIEEKVCTANDIIDLSDTLSDKYSDKLTYEQVLSLLIVANYDYIPEDELDTLFNSIELSTDDVNRIYHDTMCQFLDARYAFWECTNGYENPNADYDKYDLYRYNAIKMSDFLVINEYEYATKYLDIIWTRNDVNRDLINEGFEQFYNKYEAYFRDEADLQRGRSKVNEFDSDGIGYSVIYIWDYYCIFHFGAFDDGQQYYDKRCGERIKKL